MTFGPAGIEETYDPRKCERFKTFNAVTGKTRTMFRCKYDDCDKVFDKSSNFLSHQRRHTQLKPFMCRICNNQFSQPGSLKRHTLMKHPEVEHIFTN